MKLIETVTATGASSVFSFINIPQDFDDLILLCSVRDSTTGLLANFGASMSMALNDTAGNCYYINYQGNIRSGQIGSLAFIGWVPDGNQTANTFGNARVYIPNYRSDQNKIYSSETVSEDQRAIVAMFQVAGQVNTTLPVTKLVLGASTSGAPWVSGSVVSLYGITRGSGGATIS